VATHDYVISNGTGSAVRSDINGALAAIVSQNSNASAPATTYAYMSWADTSAGVMKMRNGANSAWISLYELDGTFLASDISLAAGSAAAPSLFFTGDTNTGLFSPGADTVALATAGQNRLHVSSGGLVGIGTTSPTQTLELGGTGNILVPGGSTFFSGGDLFIRAGASGKLRLGANTNNDLVVIDTAGRVGIGTTSPGASLDVNGSALLSNGSYLGFGNADTLIQGNSASNFLMFRTSLLERARIDSSGRLLVGTSSARSVGGAAIWGHYVEGVGTPWGASALINNNSDNFGPVLVFGKSRGTTVGSNTIVASGDIIGDIRFCGADGVTLNSFGGQIKCEVDGTPGADDMPGRLVFSTTADGAASPTERLRINNVGNAIFSNLVAVYPGTDNAVTIGASGQRWSAVWAANGTIQTSDERAKTDINDAQLGSNFIKSLRPVSYKWIDGGKCDTGKRDENNNYIYESVPGTRTHWGFIAQEVKEAIDTAGVDFGGWVLTDKDDPDSQQALRYDQFIAPLTKALQEAMERIEALEADVAALKGA
jgi:hypothetical protein